MAYRIGYVAYLLTFAVACSDTSTGPQIPQLAGAWNGSLPASEVSFTVGLTQSGGDLGGTFTLGSFTLGVDGIVTQFGRVTFDATFPGEIEPTFSFVGDLETSQRITGTLTAEIGVSRSEEDAILTRQH